MMVDKDGTEEMMRNRKDRPVELTVHKKRIERDDKIYKTDLVRCY